MKKSELVLAMEEVLADIKGQKSLEKRKFPDQAEDIKRLREHLDLSQSEFAHLFCVSLKTLQQWEQGSRHPQGPAKVLLHIIDKNPQAVLGTLHQK